MKRERDRPVTDVVITPAMIAAGVAELREKPFGEPIEEIVVDVFLAMAIEQMAEKK